MTEDQEQSQALPFTLPEDQSNQDFVILGTGMQECLLAAYLSKMQGKRGLIIDAQKIYGSNLKTISFKQLHQLNTHKTVQKMCTFNTPTRFFQSNSSFFTQIQSAKNFRGYSIDIEPNLFFASSAACECLKESDMDKYIDFRLVYNLLHLQGGKLREMPLSKGKIFSSGELSLSQKKTLLNSLHLVVKIYHKFMGIEEDQNSTQEFDKNFSAVDAGLYEDFTVRQNEFFLPFLSKLVKGSKKLIDYFAYIICSYQYNYAHQSSIPPCLRSHYTLKGFIKRFGKFIKSCGVYSENPYLYVDNGIGDIPQAFSRVASIFGSTFILHPNIRIESISQNKQFLQVKSNIMPQKLITTSIMYLGPTFHHLEQSHFQEENIFRAIFLCQKIGSQLQCPLLAYATDQEPFINPICIFALDNTSHSCPNPYIVYQYQVVISQQMAKKTQEMTDTLIKMMSEAQGDGFKDSIKYLATYIRTKHYQKEMKSQGKILGRKVVLNDVEGIDLDGHFNNFIELVGNQESYFKKPGQKVVEDDEPFGGYQTACILERLGNIDLEGEPQSQEKTQNGRIEAEELGIYLQVEGKNHQEEHKKEDKQKNQKEQINEIKQKNEKEEKSEKLEIQEKLEMQKKIEIQVQQRKAEAKQECAKPQQPAKQEKEGNAQAIIIQNQTQNKEQNVGEQSLTPNQQE